MQYSYINRDRIFNIIKDIKDCIELKNQIESEKEDNKDIIRDISESIRQSIESEKITKNSLSFDDQLKIIKKENEEQIIEEKEEKKEKEEIIDKRSDAIKKSKLLTALNENISIKDFIEFKNSG